MSVVAALRAARQQRVDELALRGGVAEPARESELQLGCAGNDARHLEDLALDIVVGRRLGRRADRELLDAVDQFRRARPALLDHEGSSDTDAGRSAAPEDVGDDLRARRRSRRRIGDCPAQLRRRVEHASRREELARDRQVDILRGCQAGRRCRERLRGCASHYFDAFPAASSASSSARKRSTTA